mgnify:CR=1 FL=1
MDLITKPLKHVFINANLATRAASGRESDQRPIVYSNSLILIQAPSCAYPERVGKRDGTLPRQAIFKIGNAYLKWAFSEAAVLFLAKCPEGSKLFARIERKHGKGRALSILAHRIGRAVYFMLARKRAFDLERFLRS